MDRGGGKTETEKHRDGLDQKHNSAVVAWAQAGCARLVPREGSSAPMRYFLHTHRHMNGQANLHGAEMFKWVNTGLWATGIRMGWGVEKKCGESPQTGSKVCEWAFSLREEKWLLAGHWEPHTQSQGRSPQLTRPLPACHTPSIVTPPPITQPHPTVTLFHQLPCPSLPHPPHV